MRKMLFLLGLFVCLNVCAAQSADLDSIFARDTFRTSNSTLYLRYAEINAYNPSSAALIVYLHGGSSKGTDNKIQLQEAAVDKIYDYLLSQSERVIFVVPQCSSTGWVGSPLTQLKQLIAVYAQRHCCDSTRIYIVGGSMGGTGTWKMLSNYPNLFAAAIPVAGNPSGCNVANLAHTPIWTVMGTNDVIMSTDTVVAYKQQIEALGGHVIMDVVEGWTHQNTCELSYTNERLTWLLSQVKSVEVQTSMLEVCSDTRVPKILRDGRIIIFQNGHAYTLFGTTLQ